MIFLEASARQLIAKIFKIWRSFNCVIKIFCYKSRYEKTFTNYHVIKIEMTDGYSVEIRSTWGSGDLLKLEIDPKSHAAWTGSDKN